MWFFRLFSSSLLFFSWNTMFWLIQTSLSQTIFCLINSQTLKMISLVESFLCPDKQETPEEGQRMQWPKCVSTNYNKDKDNSQKNHNQNNTYQASSQKFWQIKLFFLSLMIFHWNFKNLGIFRFRIFQIVL